MPFTFRQNVLRKMPVRNHQIDIRHRANGMAHLHAYLGRVHQNDDLIRLLHRRALEQSFFDAAAGKARLQRISCDA